MDLFFSFLIAAGAGMCVGVLSGLLGVGGGTLMVPLFRLGFSLEAVTATATSLFCILPTACAGAVTHIRNKTCIPRVGIALGVGGAICSPVGVWLASKSSPVVIMLAMAVILVYSATTMIRKAFSLGDAPAEVRDGVSAVSSLDGGIPSEKGRGQEVPDGSQVSRASLARHRVSGEAQSADAFTLKKALGCVVVGACAGLCSGFVGVGGGFIMVPLMVSFFGLPMSKASGTSLIAIGIIAVPGIITQAFLGNIDFGIGVAVVIGSIPGAYLGALLIKRISEKRLRLVFAVVLIISAVVLVLNEFGVLS